VASRRVDRRLRGASSMSGGRLQLLFVPVLIATIAGLVRTRAENSARAEPCAETPSLGLRHRFGPSQAFWDPAIQSIALPLDGAFVLAVVNPNPHRSQHVTIKPGQNQTELTPVVSSIPCERIETTKTNSPPRRLKSSGTPLPASRRRFLVHDGGPFDDARFYRRVECKLVAHDQECSIYAAPGVTEPEPARLAEWLDCFRSQSHAVAQVLGSYAADIDGDGRFTILLIHRPGQPGPLAYVRPTDFANCASQLSNHADMLYLSAYLPATADLGAILAHEYTHAVCSSLRPDTRESDWLSEAIAHCVEQVTNNSTTNFDHRLSRFLEHPHRYPLAVHDYFEAGRFRDHGARGATVSFLSHCVSRSGPGLLSDLARSRNVGMRNVSTSTGRSREELHRDWAVSLLQSLHQPRVMGRFASIGPRALEIDADCRTEIHLAPTSIAFVQVPANRISNLLAISGGESTDRPIVVVGEAPTSIPLNVSREGSRICVAVPFATEGTQITIGAEVRGPRRSVAIGLRSFTVEAAGTPIQFSIPTRLQTGEVVIKACAKQNDGTTVSGRVVLPATEVSSQITKVSSTERRG